MRGLLAILGLLVFGLARAASPHAALQDAGAPRPHARPALVVVTPGLPRAATLPWTDALEEQGLDAWTFAVSPRGQDVDAVLAELREAWAALGGGREQPVALAHGYGGVLLLLAGLDPAALVLVGTPLAAHPVAVQVVAPEGPVAERWPMDSALLGGLPVEPYSGELGRAYAGWAVRMPPLAPPGCPTLLVASNLDPVAPPELVRLPSAGWPQRSWRRAGLLGLDPREPSHAELLRDPALARELARFAAGEAR